MADHDDDAPPPATSGIPLLITRQQRAWLRELGFADEAIGLMTPGEAHRHLAEGRAGPAPVPPD